MPLGKVLIVDDERDMRWLLTRGLSAEGFDILRISTRSGPRNQARRTPWSSAARR